MSTSTTSTFRLKRPQRYSRYGVLRPGLEVQNVRRNKTFWLLWPLPGCAGKLPALCSLSLPTKDCALCFTTRLLGTMHRRTSNCTTLDHVLSCTGSLQRPHRPTQPAVRASTGCRATAIVAEHRGRSGAATGLLRLTGLGRAGRTRDRPSCGDRCGSANHLQRMMHQNHCRQPNMHLVQPAPGIVVLASTKPATTRHSVAMAACLHMVSHSTAKKTMVSSSDSACLRFFCRRHCRQAASSRRATPVSVCNDEKMHHV